jgi:hypothetical protein
MMQYIRYLLLRFTPGCVQRHCFQFNPPPLPPRDQVLFMQTVCAGGGGGVGPCWRPYSSELLHSVLCNVTESKPNKFLAHPKKPRRGKCASNKKQLPQSPFAGYL